MAFSKKYFKSVGYTVDGFKFSFPKAKTAISDILNPTKNLLNIENGLEEASNSFSSELSFPTKENIEDKSAEYNNFPTKEFVNESYFLYHKSNLIKKIFVRAINKILSIYGSFSYFSGKLAEKEIKLLDVSNILKFYMERRALKKGLKFQLAHINGDNPKIKDRKIHNFSITRLGKKRKLNILQPVETIIIRAQQNLDVVASLNPAQIEIEDDRIINIFKKYKNVLYKVTPLGLLFLASLKNDTRPLNDLASFSIYLQDDKNKEIEFSSGERKISILHFQVDIYLK